MNFFWRKCCVCREYKDTNSCYFPGIYTDGTTLYYHDECLTDVTCNPENYKTDTINNVTQILRMLKEIKNRRKCTISTAKSYCDKVKEIIE